MKLTVRPKTLLRHIAFVTAYFSYEIGMLYAYSGEMIFFWDAFWHLLVNVSLFYFNALVILAYADRKTGRLNRIITAIVLIALEFFAFLLMKYLLSRVYIHFQVETTHPYIDFNIFLRDTTWRFIYISGLSFGYWFAVSSHEKQKQLAEMEQHRLRELAAQEIIKRELVAIENDFLKSQINSHFLFNTLNYLHESVQDLNQTAGDALIGLSDILRYSLSTPSGGKVKLKHELKHITAVFNISRLKSAGKFYVDFSINGEPGDLMIIPLVMITLSENLLKYAELRDPASPATFTCNIEAGVLHIEILNNKRKYVSPIGYGIGIKNTKKRLDTAYAGRYVLDIKDTKFTYQLKLTIPLL